MSDDFFDDEQELMEAEQAKASASSVASKKAKSAKNKKAAAAEPAADATAPRHDAPPFWMVLAIAFIALVLGVVIGYLIGTSATLAELGNSSSSTAQQVTEGTQSATGQLPEGHPDLNIAEDGTATVAGSGSADAE